MGQLDQLVVLQACEGRMISAERSLCELAEEVVEVCGGERKRVANCYAAHVVKRRGELVSARRLVKNAKLIVGLAQIWHELDGVHVVVLGLVEQVRVPGNVAKMSENVLADVKDLFFFGGAIETLAVLLAASQGGGVDFVE